MKKFKKSDIHPNVTFEKVISQRELALKIKFFTRKLNKTFNKADVVFMIVMDGGMPLAYEIAKKYKGPLEFDFIKCKSYDGTVRGQSKITYEKKIDISNKIVFIVDDIVDSGQTIIDVNEYIKQYNPKEVRVISMFGAEDRKPSGLEEMFLFKEKPEGFLVGFGLDWSGYYRNLPFIAKIIHQDKEEVKENK